VTKGDDEGWRLREVGTNGSGDKGKWGYKSHCNGYMEVAWGLFWGRNWGTTSCIFSGEIAAAGDDG